MAHYKRDFTPPVESRTTEDLIEIMTAPESWEDEVVARAKAEMEKRGIPLSIATSRRKSRDKYQHKIRTIKSKASFTATQKLKIVLLGPILFLILRDLVPYDAGPGYRKMNRQAVIYQLIGLAFWGIAFYVYFSVIT